MEEEKCFRCMKSGRVVRLLDAIYGNEISKICEECALIEDIPIIRKPTSFQLAESQRSYTVHERLARMTGVNPNVKNETRALRKEDKLPVITLDKLRKPRDYGEVLRKREERAKIRNQPLNLIENYNWFVQRARRGRKMSLTQLGAIIGEGETNLKMIEDGFLPDDADRIIRKIEQFFQINLRKSGDEQEKGRIEQVKSPARILSFNPKSLNDLTIQDLRKLKQQREKLEQEEADRKIASKLAWQGKSREERQQEKAEQPAAIKEEESPEEKKSKKSFWDIFKRKDSKEEEDERIIVGDDVSEIDRE